MTETDGLIINHQESIWIADRHFTVSYWLQTGSADENRVGPNWRATTCTFMAVEGSEEGHRIVSMTHAYMLGREHTSPWGLGLGEDIAEDIATAYNILDPQMPEYWDRSYAFAARFYKVFDQTRELIETKLN